jgi:hypothetical protein
MTRVTVPNFAPVTRVLSAKCISAALVKLARREIIAQQKRFVHPRRGRGLPLDVASQPLV